MKTSSVFRSAARPLTARLAAAGLAGLLAFSSLATQAQQVGELPPAAVQSPVPTAMPATPPITPPTAASPAPAPGTVPSVTQQDIMRYAMPIMMMIMAQMASGGLFSDKPGAEDQMERQLGKLLQSRELDGLVDKLFSGMMQQEGTAASTLPPEFRAMMKTTVKSLLKQMREGMAAN
jgi:hypothetical protein